MASDASNPLKSARLLERRVLRHGDADAMIELAMLLLECDEFASQRARGFQMLERAIKQANHPEAMYYLAYYLLTGDQPDEYHRALALLERSVKLREDAVAINLLGTCYMNGKGTARDTIAAAQLFARALRRRQDPKMMVNLAVALLESPTLKACTKQAIATYENAIRLSQEPRMMNNLGRMYHTGNGNLAPCFDKARKWYFRAIRIADYVPSRRNLAFLILENEPDSELVHLAIDDLEQTLQKQPLNANTFVELADAYVKHGIDSERALQLYETAAIEFNSDRARSRLQQICVGDMGSMKVDHVRLLKFSYHDFMKNNSANSFWTYGELVWSGAIGVQMNREKAMAFLTTHSRSIGHNLLTLMLRRDPSCYPAGTTEAGKLLNKFDDLIDASNPFWVHAIVLSEADCEKKRLIALKSFRSSITRSRPLTGIVWLPTVLRKSHCDLPFHGCLECVTNPIRRFTFIKLAIPLNLACLLLEIEGKQQEAVKVLEGLMESQLKLVASLNLAYILMSGVAGVTNRARGMQLLEDAVDETNDVSARAMLASALSERPESNKSAMERGRELWQSVRSELEDEEELQKVRRLISESSEEKWRICLAGA